MGRPYSEDLRSRIVAAVEGGVSRNAAARQFAVSVSCVVKLLQRFRRTGTVAPAPRGQEALCPGRSMRLLVRELVAARPDLTLDELHRGAWRSRHPCRALVGQSLSAGVRSDAQKKSLHAAEQQRPDVAAARENWRAGQTAFRPRPAGLHRRDLGEPPT